MSLHTWKIRQTHTSVGYIRVLREFGVIDHDTYFTMYNYVIRYPIKFFMRRPLNLGTKI